MDGRPNRKNKDVFSIPSAQCGRCHSDTCGNIFFFYKEILVIRHESKFYKAFF